MPLTQEVLEDLLEADPDLDMYWESPDKVVIVFSHNDRETDLTLKLWPGINPVNRVNAALQSMIGHMVFCERCPHKTRECMHQTIVILGTLRMILGRGGLDRLRARLGKHYNIWN